MFMFYLYDSAYTVPVSLSVIDNNILYIIHDKFVMMLCI